MRSRTWRVAASAMAIGAGIAVALPGAAALAADRAIELVTPPGSDPKVLFGGGPATPDGNIVCFNSERQLAGAPSNGLVTSADGFCSWRTPSGWQTRWVTGPVPEGETTVNQGSQVYHVTPDGSRAVFVSDANFYPDYRGTTPRDGSVGYGTRNTFMWEGRDGLPRWLSPTPDPSPEERFTDRFGFPYGGAVTNREAVAVSDDLNYGLIYSSLRLLPEDENDTTDVYKYTPHGLVLVSRTADGHAAGGRPPMGFNAGQVVTQPGALSSDGTRAFFHHDGPLEGEGEALVQNVYMDDGRTIRHISHRRGPDRTTPDDVYFEGASADGSIVYLLSREQLTLDPTTPNRYSLYRYDVRTDELRLVASHMGDVRTLDTSRDGSTVVYTATSRLFVLRNGRLFDLGTLGLFDTVAAFGGVAHPRYGSRALRVNEDGSLIVFQSSGSYDASPAPPPPGFMQVYRWTPEEGARRISTDDITVAPTADALIGNANLQNVTALRGTQTINSLRQYPNVGRVIADDGRIFFETTTSLVPDDVNSYNDVYEWHNGRLSLVTPGTQQDHAFYHDSSADGNTVFFTTDARLIPELDRNVSADLYAARVGGGFPLPPEPRTCDGDDCQGSGPRPPVSDVPGSVNFRGPGDVEEPAPRTSRQLRLRPITARQRRTFGRRARIVLRVRVNADGWLSATARARLRRRDVRVARTVRSARSGRTVRLTLRLSRQARAVLRRGRALRVVITVAHSQSEETIRRQVVLHG